MKVLYAEVFEKIINALQNLRGRNLYGILGKYDQLNAFEKNVIPRILNLKNLPILEVMDINQSLLNHISDEDLREMVSNESSFPSYVDHRISEVLNLVISNLLSSHDGLFCKNIEILFSYGVDLSVFRIHATNQKIIFLIMPAEYIGGHINLFTEGPKSFHRTLPDQLLSSNNIWELTNE